jgi:hypothetical protein
VLQLFPYGWTWLDIQTPCREEMTLNMVLAANCTYARWVNKRPENAFLRKCVCAMHCVFLRAASVRPRKDARDWRVAQVARYVLRWKAAHMQCCKMCHRTVKCRMHAPSLIFGTQRP